jgi:fido (protein-threonine AMPylation protein)
MSLFFKNREGQTPIDDSMIKELKLTHIQDMPELYEQERENIAEAIAWLKEHRCDYYDLYFWLDVHKKMYLNVWKFAGKERIIELNNPDFDKPYMIRQSLAELSKDLKTWVELKTYPNKELSGIFHEKLLTIHPFKDGNGRWARVLTEYICKSLGIEVPNWGKNIKDDDQRRKQYIEAVIKARKDGNYEDLISIMYHE